MAIRRAVGRLRTRRENTTENFTKTKPVIVLSHRAINEEMPEVTITGRIIKRDHSLRYLHGYGL